MWVITSIATPTLLTLGWGAMQMLDAHRTEFRIARVCFLAAAVMPALATTYSLIQMKAPAVTRIGFGVATAIAIGIAEKYLLGWVSEREIRIQIDKKKEPQPVILAIDELKALLYEGETLVSKFQEDSVKPSFQEVEDWRKRTRDCARQNILAGLVTPKDLVTFDKTWDLGEVIRATVKFLDHGCFANGSTEMAVFQHLWGTVRRLEQLISKIENESGIQRESSSAESPQRWSITYEQETAMLEILEDSPTAPVMIMSAKGDRAGNAYAKRLVQVLGKAGMEIGQCVFDESWRLPTGINLWASDTADILQTSLLKAAIKATNMDCGNAPRRPPEVPGTIRYDIDLMVKSHRT